MTLTPEDEQRIREIVKMEVHNLEYATDPGSLIDKLKRLVEPSFMKCTHCEKNTEHSFRFHKHCVECDRSPDGSEMEFR